MAKPSILFFDSGVGGLSVYQQVKKLLPDAHYLYCFDNQYFPYSERSEQTIIERTVGICQTIAQSYPIDLIVIACNTASTVALPALRQAFSIPIVGTVPAIKPASELSQTKHIGLLATKGTIKRQYVDNLIENYAKNCIVEKIGSTLLVEFAERKLHGSPVPLEQLCAELADWREIKDLDAIILGCTHFPLIKTEIQHCLPQVKYFVDSGNAIAKRVAYLLQQQPLQQKTGGQKNQIFSTAPLAEQDPFHQVIKEWGFEQLDWLQN